MTQWTIVTVIIALVGLISAITSPLTKNAKSMTEAITRLADNIGLLTYRITDDEKEFEEFKTKAANKHTTIFTKLGEHDIKIANHDHRISDLEKQKKNFYEGD